MSIRVGNFPKIYSLSCRFQKRSPACARSRAGWGPKIPSLLVTSGPGSGLGEQVPGRLWLTVCLPQTWAQRATSGPGHAKKAKLHGHTGRQTPAVTPEHRAQVPGRSPAPPWRDKERTTHHPDRKCPDSPLPHAEFRQEAGSCGQRKTALDCPPPGRTPSPTPARLSADRTREPEGQVQPASGRSAKLPAGGS